MSERAIYGVDHVRELTEMKPSQRWGCTREGFPLHTQDTLPRSDPRVFPYIGLAGNLIIPINQEGVKSGKVRVIYVNKVNADPNILERVFNLFGPFIYH